MAKDGEQCSPVDPNYTDADKGTSENYLGASKPMDHPLTHSTVDANYTEGSTGGGPTARVRKSTPGSDSAGVEAPDMDTGEKASDY